MNQESIDARFAELNAEEQNAQQRLQQAQADLIAINGAKQDCQFWLNKLNEQENPANNPAPTALKPGRKKKTK